MPRDARTPNAAAAPASMRAAQSANVLHAHSPSSHALPEGDMASCSSTASSPNSSYKNKKGWADVASTQAAAGHTPRATAAATVPLPAAAVPSGTAAAAAGADVWLDDLDDYSADVDGYAEAADGTGAAVGSTAAAASALCDDDGDNGGIGTEVLFQRERVAVWPSASVCITGRLSVIKQASIVFLAWLPSVPNPPATTRACVGSLPASPVGTRGGATLPAAVRALYALHPLPMSAVVALRARRPYLVSPSLVVVLREGPALPPLHFHNGGLKELLAVLNKVCALGLEKGRLA